MPNIIHPDDNMSPNKQLINIYLELCQYILHEIGLIALYEYLYINLSIYNW